MQPRIHLAFRFHVNFYHSYRGDTPDELGFGKDIRIIRTILKVLDEANGRGVPVRGTWDLENYFSLEKIIPAHCPDILDGLQRRVREGRDEIQFMSYNNGLVSAHTAGEFERALRLAAHNPSGSGLRDLFGDGVANQVRPQEMMYTPIHLKLYRALGIDSISLYYSALPFNGFSNFIPPLDTRLRYNPLTLTYPGIPETMTLLPAYNIGDLADHLTLRRWVKALRRAQQAMAEPCDLLLLLDQDADDPFWTGFAAPGWLKRRLSSLRGLPGLLEDVGDLDYIEFTTPGRYLASHVPVAAVSFGQDTADGSFDGLSSWVEKWSNHHLFTGLERARILDLQARRLADRLPGGVQASLDEALAARLKLLSTTHFGMAAPVMNLRRERAARELAQSAVEAARAAFERLAATEPAGSLRLLDYARGESTPQVSYSAHPSRALVRLTLREGAVDALTVLDASGQSLPCAVLCQGPRRELAFVDRFEPLEEKHYRLVPGPADPTPVDAQLRSSPGLLANAWLQLSLDKNGQVREFRQEGRKFSLEPFLTSAVTYAGRTRRVEAWEQRSTGVSGPVAWQRMQGRIRLPGGCTVGFERELLMAANLPYLYVTVRAAYPRTPDHGYERGKAERLQQAWDAAWQEVLPCEIRPALEGRPADPLRVWKHNYCDHLSTFSLDYGRYSSNRELDEINNQVTHAWVAVSDGSRGLLVAQTADVAANVAFCPLRTRRQGLIERVRLNPFGTYWGRQYRYPTADTGLGKLMAVTFSAADQIKPYAPSYNGRVQEFRLMLAPYGGDRPPEAVRHDAEAFAYPYLVLNDAHFIADPPHRSWTGQGLGETPDGRPG